MNLNGVGVAPLNEFEWLGDCLMNLNGAGVARD